MYEIAKDKQTIYNIINDFIVDSTNNISYQVKHSNV